MPRYVAFLRGVSPMNCKMPELKQCFEAAGFSDVRTLLSSGNVVFSSSKRSPAAIEIAAEKAMEQHLGKRFSTFVRTSESLRDLVAREPFAAFNLPENAKPVVTFLREPYEGRLKLPIEQAGAAILAIEGSTVLTTYVPNEKGPEFMGLLERTFSKDITTRTIGTVEKCVAASFKS
jgi:uncharacterized protein (DUF1697 family)